MDSKFTILIDLDSTIYDLWTPWLEWYNRHYNDTLRLQDINTWQCHTLTKPECGTKIYSFLNKKGMFTELKPFPYALEAIKTVHGMGIKQVFCSTIIGNTGAKEKAEAIERDFPYLGKAALVLVGKNKNLVKGDVLVDDGPHNLMGFDGFRVLVTLQGAPYVYERACYPDAMLSDWRDYPDILNTLKGIR